MNRANVKKSRKIAPKRMKRLAQSRNDAQLCMFPVVMYGCENWTIKLDYKRTLKVKVKSLSHVRLSATPWTVAYQAPPSMEFSRQEYWSAVPFPSPGDLPDPGIKPGSPTLQADALPSEPPGKPQ